MFGISDIFKGIGQVVGETVHQADKLYEGTKEVLDDSWEDIKKIPDALSEGYDEELFTAEEKEEIATTVKETSAEVVEVVKDKAEEVKEAATSKFKVKS